MTSDNGGGIPGPVEDLILRRRTAVPDPLPGYFDRPALLDRLMSPEYPVAVLRAPGGFGKTALLGALCRLLGDRGIPAAWLQMDGGDTSEQVETCLAHAFRHAGIDVPAPGPDDRHTAGRGMDLLLYAVDAYPAPCTLALDNVEQLTDPGGAQAIGTLLREAPSNLRVALACRELPPSLDLLEPLLAGRVDMLTVDELRFPAEDTAAFLGKRLSDRETAAIDREYAGWPVALALLRAAGSATGQDNTSRRASHVASPVAAYGRADHAAGPDAASGHAGSANLLGNWIESRLWQRFPAAQRDFLLDAGLMDELDPVLLDEALERSDSRHRLQSMTELDGLLHPFPGTGAGAPALHPLLRRHCAARRSRESPERFRSIHHRAAEALERRGDMSAAMRHAAEAGNPALLGRLMEDAGGIRCLWTGNVQPALRQAMASLTHDAVRQRPRLALAQAWALATSDRIPEARRLYELAAESSDGFIHNPAGGGRDLRIDQAIIETAFFILGCTDNAQLESAAANARELIQDNDLDPDARTCLVFALCLHESRRAQFDAAFALIEQARQLSSNGLPYLSLHIDIQLGNMAMARGHAQEAETYCTNVLASARGRDPDDPLAAAAGDALLRELQFERNRLTLPIAAGMGLRDHYARPGNTFATQASDCAIIAEVAHYTDGIDGALSAVTRMTEYARQTGRRTLARYLAALRVDTLAAAGRDGEAERAWRAGALPAGDEDCLDMDSLDWRELEMLACARLRLYMAGEDYEAGRRFAKKLLSLVTEHRLVRTAMRVRALLTALEWRAGDRDAACSHLETFLRHYIEAGYARPVLREGDISRQALKRWLESQPDSTRQAAARDLLKMIDANEKKDASGLSNREMTVLKLLPDLRDKQIAAELSITREGVRFHVSRIFAKLGVHSRSEAVSLARSIGLLPQ
ncbi:MAG: LuxR C-terminal-related transcriptional regulator [Gammaproteobacteria bacterium]|nr:LuxR C-terminal-related transcriptional regulator [Gammaproteobacteria bacterium]